MTVYADRVARATRHLETSYAGPALPDEVAIAQVESTLALAEQQRIGNLIALERLYARHPDHHGYIADEIDASLDTDEIAARRVRERP